MANNIQIVDANGVVQVVSTTQTGGVHAPHQIIDSGSITVTSGSVTVTNLPATQPISGAVTVSNFPGTQPVSIASGVTQGTAAASAGAWPVKVTDGVNVSAVKAASTAAVVGDPSAVVALSPNSPVPTGTNTIGSVKVTDGTNVAAVTAGLAVKTDMTSIAGTAVSAAAAGVQKVGVVGNTGVVLDAATAAAVPASAILDAGRASINNPTAVADGQLVGTMRDKLGRAVVVQGHVRDLVVQGALVTITASTAETTILPQIAAVFQDLTLLVISNTSATAVRVDIRDTTGGTVVLPIYVAAGTTTPVPFGVAFKQTTLNTNWTAQCSASVTDVRIVVQAVKNI